MSHYTDILYPYSTNGLRSVRLRRADANDFTEMLAMEDMRRDGLTPARRVEINTDAYEFAARQDRYEE